MSDFSMRKRLPWVCAVLLLLLELGVIALFVSDWPRADTSLVRNLAKTEPAPAPSSEPPPIQLLDQLQAPFESSLAVRENSDFILTPPLLIQQCITPDVVISYPNE